jgi:hypothetical protein
MEDSGQKQGIHLNRNFSSISPSAISLLFIKGHTDIPFARQAVELMISPEKFTPDFTKTDTQFWGKVLHFERRYLSIDILLKDLSIKNILEISSGFSFRGLETVRNNNLNYVDTDLPDIIEKKKEFIQALEGINCKQPGKLELLPLNALDASQFGMVTSGFPAGEVAVINEGLLMYLNIEEKESLCGIIKRTLRERGGCWITADIYIKNKRQKFSRNNRVNDFYEQHQIEENKFNSFEEAEDFFSRMGFVIDKESEVSSQELSSFSQFMKCVTEEQLSAIRMRGRQQATWRLKIAKD